MIENGGGGLMITGPHIAIYRLLAARQVMRLALKGFKLSNTASWARQLRKDYGMRPRATYLSILKSLNRHLLEVAPDTVREEDPPMKHTSIMKFTLAPHRIVYTGLDVFAAKRAEREAVDAGYEVIVEKAFVTGSDDKIDHFTIYAVGEGL